MGRLPLTAGLVVVLALANCSDTPPPPIDVNGDAPFVSGERLRAQLLDGESGAELFVRWWDSTLQTSCRFHPADDGELRCLPEIGSNGQPGATPTTQVYTDAACTKEIRAVLPGQTPETYLAGEVVSVGACGDEEREIRELGPPIPEMTTWYAKNSSGACSERGPAGARSFYEIGERVDASIFVRATKVSVKRNEELDALVLLADDGASQIIGAVDRMRSNPCWLGPYGQDDGPCLPQTLAFVTVYYAESTCSQALAYSSAVTNGSNICNLATVGVSAEFVDGEPFFEFFELGDEVAKETIFYKADDCQLNSDPESDDHRYYSLKSPIQECSFPALTTSLWGVGPLSVAHTADADGIPLLATHFIYRESGERCRIVVTCDGVQRCLSSPVQSLSIDRGPFSDASCVEPVVWNRCIPVGNAIISYRGTDSCHEDATIDNLYEFAPAYDGPLYDLDDWGTCSLREREDGICYYQTGAAVDLQRYAPVMHRIE